MFPDRVAITSPSLLRITMYRDLMSIVNKNSYSAKTELKTEILLPAATVQNELTTQGRQNNLEWCYD